MPPTAYYKLIDYWMLFTLNIIIVIMIQHTVLVYRLKLEGETMEGGSSHGRLRIQPKPLMVTEVDSSRPDSSVSIGKKEKPSKDFPKTRQLNKTLRILLLSFIVVFITGYAIMGIYAEFILV